MDILFFFILAIVAIFIIDFVETRGKKYGNYNIQQDQTTGKQNSITGVEDSWYEPNLSQFIDHHHPLH